MTKRRTGAVAVTAVLTLSLTGLAGCFSKPDTPDGTKSDIYTYNAFYSTSPKTWNPHTWEANEDRIVLDYTTMGFYDVELNADKDGYNWVCEMASEFPEDVTAEYAGKFGVAAGESGKAWRIKLNPSACWEDGTKITADDYIWSMQRQLDYKMLNRRADSYTSGDFTVYGAKDYLYQQAPLYKSWLDGGNYLTAEPEAKADGALQIDKNGETVEIFTSFTSAVLPFFGDGTVQDYYGNGYGSYMRKPYTGDTAELPEYVIKEKDDGGAEAYYEDLFIKWSAKENARGYIAVTADLLDDLKLIARNLGDDNPAAWQELVLYYAGVADAYAWENVGLLKKGEYVLDVVLTTAIDDFTIKYNLTGNWLVKRDLYEACIVQGGELNSSTYGTSKDKYMSYGPYRLTSYVNDNSITFTYNPNWYGYTDGRHEGQFQTTSIKYTYLEPSTAKENSKQLFMRGELDDYNLTGEEMADYGNSRYLYVEPESYTYQFFMCTDLQKLSSRDTDTENHSVISLASFRKALSYSFNRATYCSKYDPASEPGFGVLNYSYVTDPEKGTLYRDTEEAKRVILEVNDFTQGADGKWTARGGTTFDTTDDAYAAVTGFDPEYAKELFRQAYAEAKAAGIYTDGQKVVVERGVTGISELGKALRADMNAWIAAALPAGTFTSVEVVYNDRYNTSSTFWAAVKGGDLDMAFSAWGGSPMSPWQTIYNCYVNPDNSLNYGFKAIADGKDVTINVEGKGEITASLTDWSKWLANFQENSDYAGENLSKKLGILADAPTELKVKVLAACEKAQLETYSNLPIFYSNVNALRSAKYRNGADAYLQLIGFGGIRHITYNYDNSEWASFVASKGGDLTEYYKAA